MESEFHSFDGVKRIDASDALAELHQILADVDEFMAHWCAQVGETMSGSGGNARGMKQRMKEFAF